MTLFFSVSTRLVAACLSTFPGDAHGHLSPMNESFIADQWSSSVEAKSARVGMAIDFTGVTNH